MFLGAPKRSAGTTWTPLSRRLLAHTPSTRVGRSSSCGPLRSGLAAANASALPSFTIKPVRKHTNASTSHYSSDSSRAPPDTWRINQRQTIRATPEGLTYNVDNGIEGVPSQHTVSWIRLLDACPCPQCIHPSTRQKSRSSSEALRELRSATTPSVHEIQRGQSSAGGLRVTWPSHSSEYTWDRIQRIATSSYPNTDYLEKKLSRVLWNERTLLDRSTKLRFHFDELANAGQVKPDQLLQVLEQLQMFGLVIIEGVPNQATSDRDCDLRKVAGWIGEIRDTFYGQTWDVKNMKNSKNVAYTNLNLGLHMDLLYFSSPPRFQLLHCLRNRVEGGSSYFVDAFRAAQALRERRPRSFQVLSEAGVDFEYDNDSHYLRYTHQVIQGDPYKLHSAINWSPPFQGIVSAQRGISDAELYQAIDDFATELNDPALCHEFLMKEGDLVMFDNRRVLHARRAFRDRTEGEGSDVSEGEPSRWLKGLYLDGEAVWDKLATLNRIVRG